MLTRAHANQPATQQASVGPRAPAILSQPAPSLAMAADTRNGVYRTPMLQNKIPEPEPPTAGAAAAGSAITAAH
eukprot:2566441-Alexandrium_andersonii.AAC.1